VNHSPSGDEISIGPPEPLSEPKPGARDFRSFRLALSAEGNTVALVAGRQAEILDAALASKPRFLNHGSEVSGVALSADGTWAVTSGEPYKVWRVRSGECVLELPSGPVYPGAAFSPDSRWLLAFTMDPSASQAVARHRIYRVGTWEHVLEVPMESGPWPASAFSPDGRMLALRVSRSGLRLLDTGAWTELATIDIPAQELMSWLAFSRDSTQLAVACETRQLHLWNLREIRHELAALGLDWDHPLYPPAQAGTPPLPRLVVLAQPAP
jgi:WD40 repeat protein